MTKDSEIELLDRIIKRFGPHSYVGPWLQTIQSQIVQAIRNDLSIETVLDKRSVQ